MMGKKKLDKLFQEKFKDFREVPDEKVWQAIEGSLDKRKKKRVIPIWWKLGGAAAILAIALIAINPFSSAPDGNPIITDVEQSDKDNLDQKDGDSTVPLLENSEVQDSAIVNADDEDGDKDSQDEVQDDTDSSYATTKEEEEMNVDQEESNQKNDGNLVPANLGGKETRITSIQKEENPDKDTDADIIKKNQLEIVSPNEETDVAVFPDKGEKKDAVEEQLVEQTLQGVAQNDVGQQGVKAVDNKKNLKNGQGIGDDKIKNVGEGIVKSDEKTEDKVMEDKKKSIFEEIEGQEEDAVVASRKNRWSAGASIAPVYSDAFGEGSAVHSIFVPNAKSGETNLSYGLSIAYEISDKLSIRSGVHKVDYGYGTNDIEFSSSFEGSTNGQIDNIDYALTSRNLVLQSKTSSPASFANEDATVQAFDVTAKNPARDGTMSQQFGYLEVPLELNYALVDRKVGVNLIGGISSLFLVDNSVSLSSGNQTMEMGEANNVNSVNFSTNVGFGIDYKFTPKIKLNIEPVFKYQLNTFSDVDGTFNPYSIGVYSGLSFKF